jgi:hypothetical protein
VNAIREDLNRALEFENAGAILEAKKYALRALGGIEIEIARRLRVGGEVKLEEVETQALQDWANRKAYDRQVERLKARNAR